VGLIARVVESYGISTVALSLNREISEKVEAPRALYLRFPYGAALGESGSVNQQRTILKDMFDALESIEEPGTMIDLPYRWRREEYGPVTFQA
jgi:D-proline reductase (dithiol) PrdB